MGIAGQRKKSGRATRNCTFCIAAPTFCSFCTKLHIILLQATRVMTVPVEKTIELR